MGDQPQLLSERDFPAPITDFGLNADYCAALCGARLSLQAIVTDNPNVKDKLSQTFPTALAALNEAVITCFCLTQEFLIFATDVSQNIQVTVYSYILILLYL